MTKRSVEMKKTAKGRVLRIGLIVALAAPALPFARATHAQDDDYRPAAGATDLHDAQQSRRSVVLGTGAAVPPVYTVRRGDTLWDITGRYYGNPWGWPQIWSYNPEITNPHWIYPMDHIRLLPDGERPRVLDAGNGVARPTRAAPGTIWLRDQGYLDEDALENAGVIVGSPEEQMLLSNFDEVYVRFEDGAQVQNGGEYTIFRELDDEERNDDEEGELVRIFGTVRLRSYDRDRNMGRAVITESLDPIERGFRIAPIPRHFEEVPPRENTQDLVAEVVATLRPVRMSADHQLVFINAGQEQGVQVGNRFFVVRTGDDWRESQVQSEESYGAVVDDAPEPDEDEYLPEVIAEGRVVNVRPETSALLITRSVHELEVGDRVEMRQGF